MVLCILSGFLYYLLELPSCNRFCYSMKKSLSTTTSEWKYTTTSLETKLRSMNSRHSVAEINTQTIIYVKYKTNYCRSGKKWGCTEYAKRARGKLPLGSKSDISFLSVKYISIVEIAQKTIRNTADQRPCTVWSRYADVHITSRGSIPFSYYKGVKQQTWWPLHTKSTRQSTTVACTKEGGCRWVHFYG